MADKQDEEIEGPQVKKLTPIFVDEIANISISPNGACRLQFSTWRTDEDNRDVRVDTELIMTEQCLQLMAQALPEALAQAKQKQAKK